MNEIATAARNAAEPVPSRRRFIASAIAAALGVSLADVIHPEELMAALPACSTQGQAFVPVGEFVSKNKKLSANLTVKSAEKNIATIADAGYQCRSMKVRYYAGADLNSSAKWPPDPGLPGPGPTLRMRIGDQVHIHLTNSINPADFGKTTANDYACNVETTFNPNGAPTPLYPGTDTPPSCLHGNNLTNLHYHGTHVTPDGKGDNVMVDVQPGHTYDNDFTIPLPPPAANPLYPSQKMKMGQAPGTHWYHAHKHGSVALQLLNGMAGAFIIEGEFDDQLEALMPGLRKTEKVLVIQQLGDNITVEPGPPIYTCAGGNPLPLVNGQLQPTITMQPGEIQRWRMINATMQQVADLRYHFAGANGSNYVPAIRQIAYDGVQLAPENYNSPDFGMSQQFQIAPGNRIDILVQAPATTGQAVLAFQMLHTPPAGCKVQPALIDLILVNLTVSGSPVSPAMNFSDVGQLSRNPVMVPVG